MPNQYEDKELWQAVLELGNKYPADSSDVREVMQLITQKQLEARIDEKQHAVQLIYGMEKAQMAIDELNDEIAELTKQEGKG